MNFDGGAVHWKDGAELAALRKHQNGQGLELIEKIVQSFIAVSDFPHPLCMIKVGVRAANRAGEKPLRFVSLGGDNDEVWLACRLDENHRVVLKLCFTVSVRLDPDKIKERITVFNTSQLVGKVPASAFVRRKPDRPPTTNNNHRTQRVSRTVIS